MAAVTAPKGTESASGPRPVLVASFGPALTVGLSTGILTIIGYLIGATRNFTHDGGTTVGALIADRPFTEAFGGTVSYNNHPLASVLGQLVWRLGGTSEFALRLVGVGAAGIAVGVLGWWMTRRWTWQVGLSAALLLAANPLLATQARAVRGYSLMSMGVVVSTVILIELDGRGSVRASSWDWTGLLYSSFLGIAIAGHLYGGIAAVVHVGYLIGVGRFSTQWRNRLLLGLSLGLLAYAGLLPVLLAGRGRSFDRDFPLSAARDIGGGVWWLAIAMWIVALSTAVKVKGRGVILPAVAVLGCLGTLWLLVQPVDVYPRMLQFLVPPFVAAVALGLRRFGPLAVPLALAAAAVTLAPQLPTWSADPMANEEAAMVADAVDEAGGTSCLAGWTGYPVWAYTRAPSASQDIDVLLTCDVVIAGYFESQEAAYERLRSDMDHSQTLASGRGRDILVYWSEPVDDLVRQTLAEVSP